MSFPVAPARPDDLLDAPPRRPAPGLNPPGRNLDRARPPGTRPVPGADRRPGGRPPRGPRGIDPRPGTIPGLDGVRGLAILAVLVFHFTPTVLPGGFLGVDVFFVISGFLISTLLMRELADAGRIDLPRFWLRRARRLVPALVLVVVVSVAAARVVGGDLLVGIGRQTLGALTFTTNWTEIAAGGSYFSATSPVLFVNFWSLAIEEQFYLLWPFGLVLVLALSAGTRQRLLVAGGLATTSALLMALTYAPGTDGSRAYYGTDTHAFGLMLGAGLAFAWAGPERAWLRTPLWRRWRGLAVALAALTLLSLMLTLGEASAVTFRGGILLACLATVVLLAGLLESGGPWRRLMTNAALSWLGSRSYGIYLWHWPVLLIGAALVPYAPGTGRASVVLLTCLLLTLLISETSYRAIETPIRRHGFIAPVHAAAGWLATPWQRSRLPRLVAGGLASVLVLTVVAVLTAPETSRTQQQIEQAEAGLEQAGAPDPGVEAAGAGAVLGDPVAPQRSSASVEPSTVAGAEPVVDAEEPAEDAISGWTADEEGLLVPDGEEITAIGDSLIVTSADGLTYRFPGITYAAKSNRQWKDASSVVEQALAQGTMRDNVILHFGTNAGVEEDQARAMIEALGPDRRIVLMNLYGTSTFVPPSNEIIAEIAADHPHVVVGDWNAAATAQPETLQSDRIHPDIEGMHVYAQAVAQAFDSLGSDMRAPGER
ncbi:MAG: acyltransferase family protein [Ornithinimicrobium sp.]|uniref:acyltransferase family protein n=1 Tax=Ornithinimicrobium sp. TaxID=1977084 RepID=UPI003D9BE911